MKNFKFFFVPLLVIVLAAMSVGTAFAKPGDPEVQVTLCHATSSDTNPYNKITVSGNSLENTDGWMNGHGKDPDDIWPAFNLADGTFVPAQGNQSLLQYEDCQAPPPVEHRLTGEASGTCEGWYAEADYDGEPIVLFWPGQSGTWGGSDYVVVTIDAWWGLFDHLSIQVSASKPDCEEPEEPVEYCYQDETILVPSEEYPTVPEGATLGACQEPTEVVTEPAPSPTPGPETKEICDYADVNNNGKIKDIFVEPLASQFPSTVWDGQQFTCFVPRCVEGQLTFVPIPDASKYPEAVGNNPAVCGGPTATPVAPPEDKPATGEGLSSPSLWDAIMGFFRSLLGL